MNICLFRAVLNRSLVRGFAVALSLTLVAPALAATERATDGSMIFAQAVQAPTETPAPVAPPAVAASLSGLAAWNALLGNTITGKDTEGNPLVEYYSDKGTVKQLLDDETSTGKWSFKDNKVCFEFPDDDEESCYGVKVDGSIATFMDSDGKGKRYDILPGNPKKL